MLSMLSRLSIKREHKFSDAFVRIPLCSSFFVGFFSNFSFSGYTKRITLSWTLVKLGLLMNPWCNLKLPTYPSHGKQQKIQ